jgi:HK97 family phage major capsid protein
MNSTQMQLLLTEARGIVDRAKAEGRQLNRAESARVNEILTKAEAARTRRRVENVGHIAGEGDGKSAGDLVTKALSNTHRGSGSWSTGPVEVGDLRGKALLTTTGAGADTAGGALVQPDVQPGILPLLSQPLTIADLMASATTDSNLVRSMVETLATNAADGVAEGALKPESAIEFAAVDEPVRKIATFLPISDEMLEDAPSLRGYVDARLRLFVLQEEEREILSGGGAAANELAGLLGRIPAGNLNLRSTVAGATDVDHIARGLNRVREAFLEPDAIVLNPADFERISLLKDADGKYLLGNPAASDFGRSLFGKPIVLTNAIAAGTALVGAFRQAATLYRKGGVTVEASNSHQDWFQRNQTALRAEERIALAISRPAAFATVDLGAVGAG